MRHVLSLFLTVAFATGIYAQESKCAIGIEGGPNLILFHGTKIPDKFPQRKPAVGYYAGISFQYNFSKTFSLRTGIASERKGYKFPSAILTDANGTEVATFHIQNNFNYITIPIMLRASIGNKVQYFANAGTFVGFLLKETTVNKITDASDGNSKTKDVGTQYYKTFDIGIAAGIGIVIPIQEKFALSFEIRNNLGLMNIVKNPVNDFKAKTNSTNLLIGFSYKL